MKEIVFDTKVGERDLYHFLMRHFYTSFSGIFGVILSLAALILLIQGIGKRDILQLVVLFVMAALFTVVQPLQMKMKAAQQIKKNPIFQEFLHYVVNKKNITVSQKGESTTLEWQSVRKVVESKKAFYLYMTVMNANVIPKGQMEEETINQFRMIAKENKKIK